MSVPNSKGSLYGLLSPLSALKLASHPVPASSSELFLLAIFLDRPENEKMVPAIGLLPLL